MELEKRTRCVYVFLSVLSANGKMQMKFAESVDNALDFYTLKRYER